MIIVFTGRHGVGKTTLADYIINAHRSFIKLSFATPLKKCCEQLFNIPENYFLDSNKKDCILPEFIDVTPRQLLQTFGTNVVRRHLVDEFQQICPEFSSMIQDMGLLTWIMKRKIENTIKNDIVIDDLRFINEAQMLRTFAGVKIIRLIRNLEEKNSDDSHISETEQNEIECDLELVLSDPEKDVQKIMNLF